MLSTAPSFIQYPTKTNSIPQCFTGSFAVHVRGRLRFILGIIWGLRITCGTVQLSLRFKAQHYGLVKNLTLIKVNVQLKDNLKKKTKTYLDIFCRHL